MLATSNKVYSETCDVVSEEDAASLLCTLPYDRVLFNYSPVNNSNQNLISPSVLVPSTELLSPNALATSNSSNLFRIKICELTNAVPSSASLISSSPSPSPLSPKPNVSSTPTSPKSLISSFEMEIEVDKTSASASSVTTYFKELQNITIEEKPSVAMEDDTDANPEQDANSEEEEIDEKRDDDDDEYVEDDADDDEYFDDDDDDEAYKPNKKKKKTSNHKSTTTTSLSNNNTTASNPTAETVWNDRGYEVCGHFNRHGKPCQRIGKCPFHYALQQKQSGSSGSPAPNLKPQVATGGVKKGPFKQGWTKEEHIRFLKGLQIFGRGAWKEISSVVKTRTPTQIQVHAHRFFLRQKQGDKNKKSIHDFNLADLAKIEKRSAAKHNKKTHKQQQ